MRTSTQNAENQRYRDFERNQRSLFAKKNVYTPIDLSKVNTRSISGLSRYRNDTNTFDDDILETDYELIDPL